MSFHRGGSSGEGGDLRLGVICSAAFHLFIVVVAVFGLPQLLSPPPEIVEPVVVELAQIGDKSVPPPRQVEAPKPVEKPPEPPKQQPTPEPPKPEPPPPPKPEPPPPPKPEPPPPPKPEPPKPPPPAPPPPKPAEPEPEPIPVPTPKPKPPEPPKEQPKEQPKPEPLKDIKPPPKKQQPQPDDFDSLLKSVDKLRQTSKPAPQSQPQPAAATSNKTVNSSSIDANAQPTVTEKEYVAAQIWPRWNVDLGAKGADTLQIKVKITLQPDGTVTSAKLDVDQGRYASDSFFRAAADAALRAVLSASPLKVPPTKPDLFRNTPDYTINFDPRSMVR